MTYLLYVPFWIRIWKILRGKSMVVLGDKAAGKTALLWQLGFIKDKKEDPENGFSPDEYEQTPIVLKSCPERVKFSSSILKRGLATVSQYQDTGGAREQRIHGNYKQFINENDFIIIVFDGNKFISSLPQYAKDSIVEKENYVKTCMGIFKYCYDEVNEYNKKWFHLNKKNIIVIASHLDKYNGSEAEMKRKIIQWGAQKDYKTIFSSHFYCMTLNDPAQKEITQETFNKILQDL